MQLVVNKERLIVGINMSMVTTLQFIKLLYGVSYIIACWIANRSVLAFSVHLYVFINESSIKRAQICNFIMKILDIFHVLTIHMCIFFDISLKV